MRILWTKSTSSTSTTAFSRINTKCKETNSESTIKWMAPLESNLSRPFLGIHHRWHAHPPTSTRVTQTPRCSLKSTLTARSTKSSSAAVDSIHMGRPTRKRIKICKVLPLKFMGTGNRRAKTIISVQEVQPQDLAATST